MGDEHQRRLAAALQAEQQVDDLLAGLAVEVAGRLVGQHDLRAGAQRPGDGDALLLAAGELGREMIGAMRQPHLGQQRAGRLEGVGLAGELQRQRHVLQRRHGRHQVERLEHDADVGAADERQLVLAQPQKSWPATRTGRRVARSRPAITISSEVLPEPLGPTMATDSPGATVDIDALQDLHRPGAARQGERNVAQVDDRFDHDRNRLLPEVLPRALQVSTSVAITPASREQGSDTPCAKVPPKADARKHGVSRSPLQLAGGGVRLRGNLRRPPQPGQPLRIVVLGDSLVAGFGIKPSDAFPAQLERASKSGAMPSR